MMDILTDKITSILNDRGIPAKRHVIGVAFEDSGNAEWASKYLRPDTLLSQEELMLYSKLKDSGALQPFLGNPELGATRPILEDDLRNAIESLEASTATIQKQTETLKLQCASLNTQLGLENDAEQQRSRDIARLRKKHEVGRQNTTMAAIELADGLESDFRTATEKSGAESKRILASVSTRLRQDDKALTSLETVMSSIKYRGNDASTIKRTGHLSTMLSDYAAEEIHYRLDRLYLETIQTGPGSGGTDGATSTALEEELESLYPEIAILAEMSTRQQFHEPILRELQNEHSQLRVASQEKLEQALDMLIEMTLSKQDLAKQLEVRESSSELLEQLAALYQHEACSEAVTQPSSRRESLRRRSLQPGLLLAATQTPTAPTVAQPALERLIRRVGIPPESILHPRENRGVSNLHEKRYHMSETLGNLNIAVDGPLVTHLAPLDHASQLFDSSLHANSHYETSLRDLAEEKALLGLEGELRKLHDGVQNLNLDVLHQRDSNQDRLIARWT
ncbi:hypothetical protein N7457_003109 [Penicillium paradoxum]|uniref:uncharacterized protein n=1 Tax=Penicillium paradoxum TaxID=176176 RepID=UPI002546CA02|nr:uncharacterized protein N7457_003109 [Penicillium paradoxum]KAJ5788119.1 hypothetical protein N7457_003109 [Penicillium paradoxum]